MAFTFRGVFIERPQRNERELEELFDGYARSIETPFVGVVLSFRGFLDRVDDKTFVLAKSREIPDSRVAFVDYVTFGGLEYVGGFVCQNGTIVAGSERDTETTGYANYEELEDVGRGIFASLLKGIGARPTSFNFTPFERGFFPNT